MISVRIKDANALATSPEEWQPKDGECDTLFLRREQRGANEVMLSAWKPSASELETLILGGSVVLGVLGVGHPPVLMYVSAED